MNKKVTREEVNKLFPGATILTEGGNFALPICRECTESEGDCAG